MTVLRSQDEGKKKNKHKSGLLKKGFGVDIRQVSV